MHIQTHSLSPPASHLKTCSINKATSKTLASATSETRTAVIVNLTSDCYTNQSFHVIIGSYSVGKLHNVVNKMLCWRLDSEIFSSARWKWNPGGLFGNQGAILSYAEGAELEREYEDKKVPPKWVVPFHNRKVVEHICLLKAKADLSDEEENDMLDYLDTCQNQMAGILAISLGRISSQNAGNYTHAIFIRFQRKEDVVKFYENPFYLGVLKDHVMPYCHGIVNVDYESEVEDDILSLFRKGEEFNYGVEFVLLIASAESTTGDSVQVALTSLVNLTMEFPSLIVQGTQGSNFNVSSKEYTQGIVIRFRSCEISLNLLIYNNLAIAEAFEIFMGTSEYKDGTLPYNQALARYAPSKDGALFENVLRVVQQDKTD
ncbi:hypothetical protein RJ639_010039 [Escallonia herrerae]|uniref:Stress-response A/B barrel domain-containing protein n=1 Tax=Escallonia herrerae TaxID=1293975 RepID=A0AA88VTK9_9ASTE|nr:hypothetical protein RJ639_010039 [Escallonia herrerae]